MKDGILSASTTRLQCLIQKKFHKDKREVVRDDLDLIDQVMGPEAWGRKVQTQG